MSLENMSLHECAIIFAYLNYLKVLNGKQVSKVQSENDQLPYPEKPHRPEPVRKRSKKPRRTLDELLSQMPDYKSLNDAVKAGELKPHRPEPVRRPRKSPKYTLADLLAQESEDDESGEWDTGGPVGNEIW